MSANIEQIKAMLERAGKTNLLQKQTVGLDKERTQLEAAVNIEKIDKSLEEAANDFANQDCVTFISRKKGFIAGAKWYEEQFEKDRLLAHCDALSKEDYDRETDFAMEIIEKEHRQPTFLDAINYGMRLQKEQMLKDAVEGVVEDWNPEPHPEITIPLNPKEFTAGNKVKLIIVKED